MLVGDIVRACRGIMLLCYRINVPVPMTQAGRFTPYYIYNAPINISLRGKQGADGYWGEGETMP